MPLPNTNGKVVDFKDAARTNVLTALLRTKNSIIRTIRCRMYTIISDRKSSSKLPPEAPDTKPEHQAAEQAEAQQGIP